MIGDKDTFRYAFWSLNIPYSIAPRLVSSVGYYDPYQNGRFCGHTMLQVRFFLASFHTILTRSRRKWDIRPPLPPSTHPAPLFIHSNLLKHHPSSLMLSQQFSIIKRLTRDVIEDDGESLDRAWLGVYLDGVGEMCVDVLWGGAEGEGEGEVIDEEWSGWGEVYERYGGRGGGW
jgi:alpha 1,2-mannosyltransferase